MQKTLTSTSNGNWRRGADILGSILMTFCILIFFLLSVELMTVSFEHLGKETAQSILAIASNPYIGLFVGLFITALIQSSSTCTSMAIALVASNTLTVGEAVPIIMGANIGTTLTSTIVALGFIAKKNEFRKAISAAMLHDIFNILIVLILFPLEIRYQLLTNFASEIAQFVSDSSFNNPETLGHTFFWEVLDFRVVVEYFRSVLKSDVILVILSAAMVFTSLKLFSNFIYKRLISQSQSWFQNIIFRSPISSLSWGGLITALVQSSSVTTSLVVPFVATNKVSLRMAFPFVMGANLGTTITGFIAAVSQSEAALVIAVVHFLFNTAGILLFLPFKPIRESIVAFAFKLGNLTIKNRLWGFAYIILTFFLIPFLLIYFNK
ncbi:Na/Pi symporter [Aureibacter tunicatorum]|uniref:Sodium-dependent phosphate cotransporter n=1 Tax=Aureibacter tunicatorum TaxID=866807 RepID=A0AAE4BR65_9BACT|nr:Na/Pi symporter [Aureibacter tunicatorum]MDR6237628.1 sodium-dependent phosphate cotransporter [Aureibacter tunicatorum]BDD02663.1 sodium:phosphate symporter [Aureibacter tunicatorum]